MDYVIARKWPNGSLCCYAYGSQVFSGTIEEAEEMRDFINGRAEEGKVYEIYPISSEPLNTLNHGNDSTGV